MSAAAVLRLATVRRLYPSGFSFVPLVGKRPPEKGWTKRPREMLVEAEAWARHGNIGIRTGSVSGVVVVDVDLGKGAVRPEEARVPTWTARTGGGGLHVLYALPPGVTINCPTRVWGKDSHVEIKGDGGQVVAVGSIHPDTGRTYEWEPGLSPDDLPLAPIPPALLARIVAYEASRMGGPRTASASPRPPTSPGGAVERARRYLSKMDPAVSGSNGHDTAFHAACAMVEGFALDIETALALLLEEWNGRCVPPWTERELRHKCEDADSKATNHGYLLDAPNVKSRRRPKTAATGSPPPSHKAGAGSDSPARRCIRVSTDMGGIVDAAEAALIEASAPLYSRSRLLVRVVRDGGRRVAGLRRVPGAPYIDAIPSATLREWLAGAAGWEAFDKRTEKWHPVLPPPWAVDALLARGEWRFPPLVAVVEAPTMRSDGTVLQEPGYDGSTGILYETDGTAFARVADSPTMEDARAALRVFLDIVSDFEFRDDSDRAAFLAALLTALARQGIDGPTPLFAIRSYAPGSGKSLLASVVAVVATGRSAAVGVVSRDPAEMAKALLTAAVEAHALILFDNVAGVFGSPELAAYLTAETIRGRILGETRSVTALLRPTWILTGNNVVFASDLGRRAVPVDLAPTVEKPEDRTGFKYPELLVHVRENRPALVHAGLTILRAHVAAGRPGHGGPRFASFEAWDDSIRAPLIWVGAGDPCAGRKRIREEGDSDLETLRALMGAWDRAFGSTPTTAAEAVKAAEKDEPLRAVLPVPEKSDKPTSRALGNMLRGVKGRIVNGRRFVVDGERGGVATWALKSDEGGEGGEGGRVPTTSPAVQPPLGSSRGELESDPQHPLDPLTCDSTEAEEREAIQTEANGAIRDGRALGSRP